MNIIARSVTLWRNSWIRRVQTNEERTCPSRGTDPDSISFWRLLSLSGYKHRRDLFYYCSLNYYIFTSPTYSWIMYVIEGLPLYVQKCIDRDLLVFEGFKEDSDLVQRRFGRSACYVCMMIRVYLTGIPVVYVIQCDYQSPFQCLGFWADSQIFGKTLSLHYSYNSYIRTGFYIAS